MKNKTSYVISLIFMLLGTAWGCGPEYDEDSDLEVSLRFDPAKTTTFDPPSVLQALDISEDDYYRPSRVERNVLDEVNRISDAAGRQVEFVQTGSETSGKSLLASCPLRGHSELSEMFDELRHSKMIIISRSRGRVTAKYNEWDAVPEDKRGKANRFGVIKTHYTDWLDSVLSEAMHQCEVNPDYYPWIERRVKISPYVAPRSDELFTQLRDHPQLHYYASLVEALVLFHEKQYDHARQLAHDVTTQSKDEQEVAIATAIEKLKPGIGEVKKRYVIDRLQESRYSWGACASNTPTNTLALIGSAAKDRSLSDEDFRILVGWRVAMLKSCNKTKSPELTNNDISEINPHLQYMEALEQFYQSNYEQAAKIFAQASDHGVGWVGETASYLVARSMLQAGLKGWGSYENSAPLNVEALDAAKEGVMTYLERYPQGEYVSSARGMLRRVAYVQGEKDTYHKLLDESFDALLRKMALKNALDEQDKRNIASRLNEYAIYTGSDGVSRVDRLQAALDRIDLSNNKDLAAIAKELDYLKAAIKAYEDEDIEFFDKNRTHATKLITYHGILRARALEKKKRYSEANAEWQRIKTKMDYPTDSELSIAANIMKQGNLADLLKAKYELSSMIIGGYLSAQCGEKEDIALLDMSLDEKKTALVVHDLAMRELTTGKFNEAQELFDKYDDKTMGDLSSIRTAVKMVATKSNLGKGYMNIGYYLATHGEPYTGSSIHASYTESANGTCIQTNGHDGSYTYFLKALEQYETSSSEDEAKTLHFLVLCDKIGAGGLACWGRGERQPGKLWFNKLHSEYPNSKWSKKTRYYYD